MIITLKSGKVQLIQVCSLEMITHCQMARISIIWNGEKVKSLPQVMSL